MHERERDAERDRHVHVDGARAKRMRRALEKRLAGVGRGRQGDEGGQPMEKVAGGRVRVAVGARPERDRQQHDIHRAESRDAEAAQQPPFRLDLDAVEGLGRERIGGIAERLQPLEDDRRVERPLVPLDGHPACSPD